METPIALNQDTDALIVVDVQPTFMPGGGLPVPGGDEVVPIVQNLIPCFDRDRRFATLDMHPSGHISLASSYQGFTPMTLLTLDLLRERKEKGEVDYLAEHACFDAWDLEKYLAQVGGQMLWPDHAIMGTPESMIHPELDMSSFKLVLGKGDNPLCDSYSGFYDNLRQSTGFGNAVAHSGAKRLFLCGLAFDFCVGWTALDARIALPDVEVFVLTDATRSVGLGDSIQEMTQQLLAADVRLIETNYLANF